MFFLWFSIGVLGFILLFLIVTLILIRKVHKSLFNHRFMPNPDIKPYTYEEFGVNRKDYDVICNGMKLKGYFYYPDHYDQKKLIVYSHGMFSSKEAYMQDICSLAKNGYLVYAYDYLGTNESDGKDLIGFGNSVLSLDAVLRDLKNNDLYKDLDIYCIGHSWGGFATLSIPDFHPDVKGLIALAPMTSIYNLLHHGRHIPALIAHIFTLYDKKYCSDYSKCDGVKALQNYSGKALIIQSEDDDMVPYSSSLGLIKKKVNKDSIETLTLQNKKHNPLYTDEGVKILYQFYSDFNNVKSDEEYHKVVDNFDSHKAGEIDQIILNKILEFIKK